MSNWLGATMTGAATLACVAVSSAFGAAASGSPTQITGDWQVDIRTVCAVAGVVIPAVMWLTRKYAAIEIRLAATEERFARLERTLEALLARQKDLK